MNVRLRKTWSFSSGVIWSGEYRINIYSMVLDMLTATDNSEDQNIAYERINHWIYQTLQDSVLIDKGNDLIPAFQTTGQRVIAIPGLPVDQLIGMMLFSKLSAIVEKRLQITRLSIGSDLGDNVMYTHECNDPLHQFENLGWWNDSGPGCIDQSPNRQGKVINLERPPEWSDFDLGWDDQSQPQPNTVVFGAFPPHEDQ